MTNKIAKERVIYDNYDLWENYPDEDIIEDAKANGWIDEDEEPTDNQMMEWRYRYDELDWDDVWYELRQFFQGKTVGFFGEVGLWYGVGKAGAIGDFETLYYKAITDCAYVKIYDENGHLYLTCSHHDGTCHFEIKVLTTEGREYLDRWEWGTDNRTQRQCHEQIYKRYSVIPRFAEKVYGCKAREYIKPTKADLVNKLNNEARSNYCA